MVGKCPILSPRRRLHFYEKSVYQKFIWVGISRNTRAVVRNEFLSMVERLEFRRGGNADSAITECAKWHQRGA